jgi:hypothetical protein
LKVIAVDTAILFEPMLSIQQQIRNQPPTGWEPVFFDTASALLAELKNLALAPREIFRQIEIVSEGSPVHLDHVAVPFDGPADPTDLSPAEFGAALARLPGIRATTVVYLSGCNTGLADWDMKIDECTAQVLADASGALVRGAAGFIEGLHATGNESVSKSGDNGEQYQYSRTAKGRNCWNPFKPH